MNIHEQTYFYYMSKIGRQFEDMVEVTLNYTIMFEVSKVWRHGRTHF